MYKILLGAVAAAALASAPVLAADDSSMKTPSSGPGVQGDVGGKNGPSAKPLNDKSSGSNASSNSNSGASAGSSGKGTIDPTTQPSQDSTGVEGAPGQKNGPAAGGSNQ